MLFYRKSDVKNAIFLDFRAFYALKCVYFKAFCSFRQVIFASNTNFNTKNYTKTIPILIPVQLHTPMAASSHIFVRIEKATFMAFLDSVKTGNMDNFLNHWGEEAVNIFNAIFDGDGRKDVSLNPLYKSYYDIYASNYSHRYLPRCEETIGTLLAEFES